MTYTAEEMFGVQSAMLAETDVANPTTPTPTMATTRARNVPPENVIRALLDPHGSAIFWVALAAILGLVLVTGQVRVEAALGGRAGRSRRGGS
jgi:hypothetical protein